MELLLALLAYIFLSALKLFIGYLADSEALKADGLNNSTDIIASIAVLIGLKLHKSRLIRPSIWSLEIRNSCIDGCFFYYGGSWNSSFIYSYLFCF